MYYSDQAEQALQELLTKNIEASEGYHKAASMVDDTRLTRMFGSQEETRRAFSEQIGREMGRHGRVPERKTTIDADAHRVWMDIKDTLGANGPAAVLNECLRGDRIAQKAYRDVLRQDPLPQSTRTMLLQQLTGIEESIEHMEAPEEVYASVS
jgi:uncharacterized protein (TIGR02284 family)